MMSNLEAFEKIDPASDLWREMAAEEFGVPLEAVTIEQRYEMKKRHLAMYTTKVDPPSPGARAKILAWLERNKR
jgi:hypothetical protein